MNTEHILKTVGIIGGFGPEATALFYKELIQESRNVGLKHQPHLIVWNVPVPKKLESDLLVKNTSIKECIPLLTNAAINLERIGADFIVLPCNTLHTLAPSIRKSIRIPLLSIIDTTIMHLHTNRINKIGLLGTSITVRHNLFARSNHVIRFVLPTPMLQKKIDCALHIFVSTGDATPLKKTLGFAQHIFRKKNVRDVLVACTDFHGMLNGIPNMTIHDTLSILIQAVVKNIANER